MQRRALLASTAVAASGVAGCLVGARRQVSGPVRFDHARARVHDADQPFVHGGIGGDGVEDPYAAWLFTDPPPADVSVFTDRLGAERQRQWDNEIHNENYDDGFMLLAQVRTPRERARTLRPAPTGCDADWTGWRRARVPVGLEPAELSREDVADADEVVATLLSYVASAEAPDRLTVPFLSERADTYTCAAANATLTGASWTPP
jgi:hypothetical protein